MGLALYVESDTLIQWDAMAKASDGSYVNDATVTFTLKTETLDTVGGASGLTMSYVSGSNGKYQGTLPSTVTLTAGKKYWLEITAVSGSLDEKRRIPCYGAYKQDE